MWRTVHMDVLLVHMVKYHEHIGCVQLHLQPLTRGEEAGQGRQWGDINNSAPATVAWGSHTWPSFNCFPHLQSQAGCIHGKAVCGRLQVTYLHVFGYNVISGGCLKSPAQLLVGLSWCSDARPRGAEAEERETTGFLLYRSRPGSVYIHSSAAAHPQWPIYTSEMV